MNTDESLKAGVAALTSAVNALSAFSDEAAHAATVALFAWRSFNKSSNIVRLPLIVIVEDQTDLLALRQILVGIFNVSVIHALALSQSSLMQLFALDTMLLLDLTSTNDGTIQYVRQLAAIRSIPGNVLGRKSNDVFVSVPIYGDTLILASETAAEALGAVGVVVNLVSKDSAMLDMYAMIEKLGAVKPAFEASAGTCYPEIAADDLPSNRFLDSTKRRGYRNLAALARAADSAISGGIFVAAVQTAWRKAGERAAGKVSERRRRGYLAGHILTHIARGKPDYVRDDKKGYRLDLLANFIRRSDPELFAVLDATALGKLLSLMNTGAHGRTSFYGVSAAGEPARVYRAYVVLSDSNLETLKQMKKEAENEPAQEVPTK